MVNPIEEGPLIELQITNILNRIITGTLSVKEIVEGQPGAHWNVFIQPLGFILFLVCALACCGNLKCILVFL